MPRHMTTDRLLNCGCARRTAAAIYSCLNCGNDRCYEHRENGHFCPECKACRFKHGYPLHEWVGHRLVEVGTNRRPS